jgi:hypothetical protein
MTFRSSSIEESFCHFGLGHGTGATPPTSTTSSTPPTPRFRASTAQRRALLSIFISWLSGTTDVGMICHPEARCWPKDPYHSANWTHERVLLFKLPITNYGNYKCLTRRHPERASIFSRTLQRKNSAEGPALGFAIPG